MEATASPESHAAPDEHEDSSLWSQGIPLRPQDTAALHAGCCPGSPPIRVSGVYTSE